MDNKPQFVAAFIEMYKRYPCLWKYKDECYHNKKLKDDAYQRLLNLYKTAMPQATTDTVKKKINNLKSTFRKELKKMKAHKAGASDDDLYTPSLWYFDLLMFTADQEPRRYIDNDNVEMDQNEASSQAFCEDDTLTPPPALPHLPLPQHSPPEYDCPEPPPQLPPPQLPPQLVQPPWSFPASQQIPVPIPARSQVKKRKNVVINAALKALKIEDEYDGLATNVACKLRRMSEEQKWYAESLINKIILYGIRGRLQEKTDVTGVVSDPVPILAPTGHSNQFDVAVTIKTEDGD